MAQARTGACWAVLADGSVLIAGGMIDMQSVASAELFVPSAGGFQPTGSLSSPRTVAEGADSCATTLADGRVLIAGNGDERAEIYDPQTGSFGPTASPAVDRVDSTTTLLRDGRMLLAGGRDLRTYVASAEIYDPATGTFLATGSLKAAREKAREVLLADGRVLVIGGDRGDTGMGQEILASAEIYDPSTGKWTQTGSMRAARTGFAALSLQDGRVLVVGGHSSDGNDLAAAEIYDPATAKFAPAGMMTRERSYFVTATLLADGRVLVAGGDDTGSTAEVYDPVAGKFTLAGVVDAGFGGIAVRLQDGRVLFPGSPSVLYWP